MGDCINADRKYHAPVADQRAAADFSQDDCKEDECVSWERRTGVRIISRPHQRTSALIAEYGCNTLDLSGATA
jgi:hypothetical protein